MQSAECDTREVRQKERKANLLQRNRENLIYLRKWLLVLSVFLLGGNQVRSSHLHHGAAGHGCGARPLGAAAQLDGVVHHHIPLEQDGGGHERVSLRAETEEPACVYI